MKFEIWTWRKNKPTTFSYSVGDSLTNDNSSPDVTRGRLEASISGTIVVGRCSFRVRVTDNYNYNYGESPI